MPNYIDPVFGGRAAETRIHDLESELRLVRHEYVSALRSLLDITTSGYPKRLMDERKMSHLKRRIERLDELLASEQ